MSQVSGWTFYKDNPPIVFQILVSEFDRGWQGLKKVDKRLIEVHTGWNMLKETERSQCWLTVSKSNSQGMNESG